MNAYRNQGFTLLELLLAVAVFALVGLAATVTVSSVLDGRDHHQKVSQQLNRTEQMFVLLAQDLTQMAQQPLRDERGDDIDGYWLFSADQQSMEWLAINSWNRQVNPHASSLTRVRWLWRDQTITRAAVSHRNPVSFTEHQAELLQADGIRWRFFYHNRWQGWLPPAPERPQALELTLTVPYIGKVSRLLLLPEPADQPLLAQGGRDGEH